MADDIEPMAVLLDLRYGLMTAVLLDLTYGLKLGEALGEALGDALLLLAFFFIRQRPVDFLSSDLFLVSAGSESGDKISSLLFSLSEITTLVDIEIGVEVGVVVGVGVVVDVGVGVGVGVGI